MAVHYLYGFCEPGSHDLGPTGIGEPPAPVTIRDVGRIGVVTHESEAPPAVTERDIVAHDRVLSLVMARRAVLPVQFGTVAGWDRVARFVDVRADELEQQLCRVRGHVEVGIKVLWQKAGLVRDLPAEVARLVSSSAPVPEAAARRVGAEVEAALDRLRARYQDRVVGELGRLAREARIQPLAYPRVLFSAAFLVRTERVPQFRERADRLAAQLFDRLTVRYVDPYPPYSFVDIEPIGDEADE